MLKVRKKNRERKEGRKNQWDSKIRKGLSRKVTIEQRPCIFTKNEIMLDRKKSKYKSSEAGVCLVWSRNNKKAFIVSLSSQFSSVTQSCPTLCDPMNRSTLALPVHHQLPEFTQTHVHPVSDAIQPSHPLSSPSFPAPNPSQHQSLFQWVNSSHQVAKVLEFQL